MIVADEIYDDFVTAYVDAVASDPSRSWQMLTRKFQRESGGFETYREFAPAGWEPMTR